MPPPSGAQVAGLQWTLNYPVAGIGGVTITSGPALTAAGKSIVCASSPGSLRCLAIGLNANAIGGGVIAGINVSLLASAAGAVPVGLADLVGVDARGARIPFSGTDGAVNVPVLQVGGLSCPASLGSGASGLCTVTLSYAAPAVTAVALSSSSTVLSVPGSVSVAAGAVSAGFTSSAGNIAANQTATVTASLGTSSQAAPIALTAPALAVSSLVCGASTLASNGTTTCTVGLNRAASAVTTVTLSSSSTALSVPGSVSVAAGVASVGFTATAGNIPADQTATVTASLGTSLQATPIALTAPILAVSSLVCGASSLVSNASITCTAGLNRAAPAPTTVTLSSNSSTLSVPGSVTVAAGAASVGFTATAGPITVDQTATITAALGASTQTAAIGLLAPGPAVSSLACGASSLVSNASTACTVNLTGVAPALTTVALLSNSTTLSVPSSVAVAAGATSAGFTATAGSIAADQTATIAATLGASTQSASIGLTAPALAVSSLICTSASLVSNAGTNCIATLNRPAPAPATVTLSSNSTTLLVPGSVAVAAGAISAGFTATAGTITADQTATITALLGASTQTASIGLTAPPLALSSLVCTAASLASNASTSCTATLNRPAPAPATVTLSSNSIALSVPSFVFILSGATAAAFTATAESIAADQTVTITATLGASTQTASMALSAPVLALSSLACSPSSLASYVSAVCTVILSQAAPEGGAAVSLSSNNAALTVPASLAVPAGSSAAAFTAIAGTLASNQSAVVSASLNGANAPPATFTLSLTLPGVTVAPASAFATAGGGPGSIAVTVTLANGAWTATSSAAWVTITAGASGLGNGTVSYRVAANPGAQRTGAIVVADQTVTITQSAAACAFSINPPGITVGSGDGTFAPITGSFTLTATNCSATDTWTAVSSSPLLSIAPPSGGNGTVSTTIGFSLFVNTTTRDRDFTINVAGQTFQMTQQASADSQLDRVVRALYQTILGREPDPGGFAFWTGPGALRDANGIVLVNQMADDFYTSPEFRATGWEALSIYQAILGRLPSFAEWLAATTQIRAGGSVAASQLVASLAGAGWTNAQFVAQAIRNGYGRPASQTEMATFGSLLDANASSTARLDFLNNTIFASPEFQTMTNPAFVAMLYYTILVRDPDPDGLAFWSGGVTNPPGQPGIFYVMPSTSSVYGFKLAVIGQVPPNPSLLGFLGSPEFQGLIQ